MKRFSFVAFFAVLLIGLVSVVTAQDEINSVCLMTDVGRVNDGTFNQFAYEGMLAVAEEYDLDHDYVETVSERDYVDNINACLEEGYDIIITVGYLIADATLEAALANPGVYFMGVDQYVEGGPANYIGIQFKEDEAAFLAGALAALVAEDLESDTVAGIYGVDIPPVKRFRNGFEQGVAYINPEIRALGVYIDDFNAPDRGRSAAEQFIGEGASVIFGAGGPTGSGGITAAAQSEIYVIGVDQDEYLTTFGEGETPGSEYIISSAIKRVDQGVYDMVEALVLGEMDRFPGGENYLMDAALAGVGLAPKHEADIDDAIYEQVDEIFQMLVDGEIETGVDLVSGDLIAELEASEDE